MKILLSLLALLGLSVLGFIFFPKLQKAPTTLTQPVVVQQSTADSPTASVSSAPAMNQSQTTDSALPPLEKSDQPGLVSGKLCYPSEFLPAGTIEAKRDLDGQVFSQNYPGSQNGGQASYEFELAEGNYVLRYQVESGLSGYSTTVCPSGNETTCSDAAPRQARLATVAAGGKISDYHLCDFYYQKENAPQF